MEKTLSGAAFVGAVCLFLFVKCQSKEQERKVEEAEKAFQNMRNIQQFYQQQQQYRQQQYQQQPQGSGLSESFNQLRNQQYYQDATRQQRREAARIKREEAILRQLEYEEHMRRRARGY